MNPFDRDDATDVPSMQELRELMAASARPVEASSACLDDDTIAALADGSLSAAARATTLPHLASCARCRGVVASVSRALGDRDVARQVTSLAGGRRFYRLAVPLAAAALVALVLSWPGTDGTDSPHRSPTITAAAAPELLSPVGTVAVASHLRWRAVPGADQYRVTLFDDDGTVLYESEVAATVVALPDSVVPRSGRPYLWKVEARTGFDRWSASELVRFSVGAP